VKLLGVYLEGFIGVGLNSLPEGLADPTVKKKELIRVWPSNVAKLTIQDKKGSVYMEKIKETKVWKIILILERFIIISMSSLLTLAVVACVILRYIFNTDLYGIEEFTVIFALWLYFTGAAYGSYEGSHISAEIILVFLKKQKLLKFFNILKLFISTFTSVVLTFWGFKYLLWGLQKGARSTGWRIPLFISQSPIFIGFLLISMYYFVRLIKNYKNSN